LISGNCRRGRSGAERLHADALRRRLARREESDPAFAREMPVLFADLARGGGIKPRLQWFLERALRAAGPPGDVLVATPGLADRERRVLELRLARVVEVRRVSCRCRPRPLRSARLRLW